MSGQLSWCITLRMLCCCWPARDITATRFPSSSEPYVTYRVGNSQGLDAVRIGHVSGCQAADTAQDHAKNKAQWRARGEGKADALYPYAETSELCTDVKEERTT
jgi:hypothetical protein